MEISCRILFSLSMKPLILGQLSWTNEVGPKSNLLKKVAVFLLFAVPNSYANLHWPNME
jgi:hypothetical protein